jgi:hypothetical protein
MQAENMALAALKECRSRSEDLAMIAVRELISARIAEQRETLELSTGIENISRIQGRILGLRDLLADISRPERESEVE